MIHPAVDLCVFLFADTVSRGNQKKRRGVHASSSCLLHTEQNQRFRSGTPSPELQVQREHTMAHVARLWRREFLESRWDTNPTSVTPTKEDFHGIFQLVLSSNNSNRDQRKQHVITGPVWKANRSTIVLNRMVPPARKNRSRLWL